MVKLRYKFNVLVWGSIFLSLLGGCASSTGSSSQLFALVSEADQAYEQRRWFEASLAYTEVTKLVPNDHYAWFRLANTQLRAGNIDGAIFVFEEAIKRNPQHAKTHFNLSIAYVLKAVESLEQSGSVLRASDPGHILVSQRIEDLKKLIDQPTEITRLPNSRSTYVAGY